ncbi:hypothetical protein [Brevundimonas aurantiaca]|uniref:hypothetical protein n=1 Tax=Brevundimonas aurantiaca TaxID=74316 RepID=UPI002FDCB715
MKAFLPALAVSALLAGAVSAKAQDAPPPGEDWVLTTIPERKATLAIAEFTSGITLAARCMDGDYDLFIAGLPPMTAPSTTRTLGLSVGEEEGKPTVWSAGENGETAFSRMPALVARRLAKGGALQITASGPDNRRYRYVMDINPSSTAIAQTLQACGRPLVDPRDSHTEGAGQDGLPPPFAWERQPRPDFPMQALNAGEGYATLTCVPQPDGRISDCQIEGEWPRRLGIGRAALRSIDRARMRRITPEEGPAPPFEYRVVAFTITFKVN